MKTKQMKAKLRIEQGQLTITPEDPSHQDMIEYYFDCDAVEMDAIEVTMEVIVDGPDTVSYTHLDVYKRQEMG